MQDKRVNVLFISRRNTLRSLLAEASLNHLGMGRFRGFSCGAPSLLGTRPHPLALDALTKAGIPSEGLHCKGWDKFSRRGSIEMEFVVHLADELQSQTPSWPNQPIVTLWSYPDIAEEAARGPTDAIDAAVQTLHSLRRRLELLVILRSRSSDRVALSGDVRDLAY